MSDEPIVLLVSMKAKVDRIDEMREAIVAVAAASRLESGCEIYQLPGFREVGAFHAV